MQPSIFPSVLIVKRVCVFACLNTSRLCLSLTSSPSAAACARSPMSLRMLTRPRARSRLLLGLAIFWQFPKRGALAVSQPPDAALTASGLQGPLTFPRDQGVLLGTTLLSSSRSSSCPSLQPRCARGAAWGVCRRGGPGLGWGFCPTASWCFRCRGWAGRREHP